MLMCYNILMNLDYEKKAWKRNYRVVVGLDEAGRGPLAGPVTAAAVAVDYSQALESFIPRLLKEVDDSKKLSAEKREVLYEALVHHSRIHYQVSWVGPQVIDRINILEATKKAMKRSVQGLEKKIGKKPDLLFLDGNFLIDVEREQKAVKHGDGKVFVCACASIISKVFRDRSMRRYHRLFPEYGFDRHKGYPTRLHRKRIKKYGPCRIHRTTFKLL